MVTDVQEEEEENLKAQNSLTWDCHNKHETYLLRTKTMPLALAMPSSTVLIFLIGLCNFTMAK